MGETDSYAIAEFLSTPIADGEYRGAAEVHIERGRPPLALQREERNGNEITGEPQPPAASIAPADELIAEDGEEYERDVERVHHPPITPRDQGTLQAILPPNGCPDPIQPRNG